MSRSIIIMIGYIKYLFAKFTQKIQIPSIRNSNIHTTSKICQKSNVIDSEINKYSYIGSNCTIACVEIGMFCSISDNVCIGGAAHPIDWISTSPIFHTKSNILGESFATNLFDCYEQTIIGHDVWIGANCNIKSGIKIGTGSIIGMGSVVTKNIGEYEIWAGNPAKLIKKRFSDEIIHSIKASKWWELDINELKSISSHFNNPEIFLKKLNHKL